MRQWALMTNDLQTFGLFYFLRSKVSEPVFAIRMAIEKLVRVMQHDNHFELHLLIVAQSSFLVVRTTYILILTS